MNPLGPVIACALCLTACGTGPLPEPHRPTAAGAARSAGFPSQSEEPLALHRAIYERDLDTVRQLLEAGADPNARWGDRGDHTALGDALGLRHGGTTPEHRTELARLLLAAGADPNAAWCPFESRGSWGLGPSCTSTTGVTPLMVAAFTGPTELVVMLLDAGADPSPRHFGGLSALDYAFDEIAFEAIARRLFPDVATRDRLSWRWLMDYRNYHDEGEVSTALSRALGERYMGVHFNILAPPPPPPGTAATQPSGDETRVISRLRILLRLGADPNERVNPGVDWTPLMVALRDRQYRAAYTLLKGGADANRRSCSEGRRSGATSPLAQDSRCNSINGMTPLMWMARDGVVEAIPLLREFGADLSAKDWAGRTALDYASTRGMKELLAAGRGF